MKIDSFICDRCGDETSYYDTAQVRLYEYEDITEKRILMEHYDLCFKCRRAFDKFMNPFGRERGEEIND